MAELPRERYYTSLKNSMSGILFDMKGDVRLQLKHVAGGQHTQTEFIFDALSQILEKIAHVEAMVENLRKK